MVGKTEQIYPNMNEISVAILARPTLKDDIEELFSIDQENYPFSVAEFCAAYDSAILNSIDENADGVQEIDFLKIVSNVVNKMRTDRLEGEYDEQFSAFDKDNNGSITIGELRNVMKNIGEKISEDELNNIICKMDVNDDGEIDLKEFKALMRSNKWATGEGHAETEEEKKAAIEAKLKEQFDAFDKDGKGVISFMELKHNMKNIGSDISAKDVEDLFDRMDEDKSNTISFKEFKEMMQTLDAKADAKT